MPSGHVVRNITGEGTGGSALGFPFINRRSPSGVSIEHEIGTFPRADKIFFVWNIADVLPLPAPPTYIT